MTTSQTNLKSKHVGTATMIKEILKRIEHLVSNERRSTHGNYYTQLNHTANLWNAYLGTQIFDAALVAEFNSLQKKSRKRNGTYNEDDWVDDAAYSILADASTRESRQDRGEKTDLSETQI